MSEIIMFSPELQAAVQRKQDADREHCFRSYMNMINSLVGLKEAELVQSAFNYEQQRLSSGTPDLLGNAFVQALFLKNKNLACSVQKMIDSGIFPET